VRPTSLFGRTGRWRFVPVLTLAVLGGLFAFGAYRYALSGQVTFGTMLVGVAASLWALAIVLIDMRASEADLRVRLGEMSSRLDRIESVMEVESRVSKLAGRIDSTTLDLTEMRTELSRIAQSKANTRLDEMEKKVEDASRELVLLNEQNKSNSTVLTGMRGRLDSTDEKMDSLSDKIDSTTDVLSEIRFELKRILESD